MDIIIPEVITYNTPNIEKVIIKKNFGHGTPICYLIPTKLDGEKFIKWKKQNSDLLKEARKAILEIKDEEELTKLLSIINSKTTNL